MKSNQLFSRTTLFSVIALMGLILLSACGDDEPGTGSGDIPIASFGTEIDGLEVTFVNASVGATSYSWDFGDTNSSTDENPTYTYDAAGTYTVTFTATNDAGDDSFEASVTVDEPGALFSFISGKDWQLVRGDAQAIALGPAADAEVTWGSQSGPWFALGGSGTCNGVRSSAMNDIYTFNTDGTYDVEFNGDFWGEYGIWLGTDFHETNIDISGGSLPPNAAGNNVDAFIAGSWEYTIDETARTISTIGAGAHIISPRYKNGQSSHEVGEGITYTVHHTAEGTDADTLVIYIETFDNDFNSEPRQYMTFASYKTTVPELCTDGFVCTDHATEVSASTISVSFLSEGDFGSGVGSVSSSSTIDYGVEIGGETCTRYTRTDADGGFTDFKINADVNDIRFDTDGTYDFSIAQVDVFIPAADNDFSGDLVNQVMVKLADVSCTEQFWTNWATIAVTDIATDEWVTLTFDFTDMIDDSNASSGIRDDFDTVILEFGGSGHGDAGVAYYKDFKFVE